jgi:hypothetical protein
MQTANRLRLSLEPTDYNALSREMRPMAFKAGQVLYEPRTKSSGCIFPNRD